MHSNRELCHKHVEGEKPDTTKCNLYDPICIKSERNKSTHRDRSQKGSELRGSDGTRGRRVSPGHQSWSVS